jgi:Na+-transporting methylmalonyl-CoA/oxaloacetate decarboxylase gamma subunit
MTMENPLLTTLIVTLIGMAVVFAAMGMILGSMALLTRLAGDKPGPKSAYHDRPALPSESDTAAATQRAAAVAVALARARQSGEQGDLDAEPLHTPWGDFYRRRQLDPCGRGRVA